MCVCVYLFFFFIVLCFVFCVGLDYVLHPKNKIPSISIGENLRKHSFPPRYLFSFVISRKSTKQSILYMNK